MSIYTSPNYRRIYQKHYGPIPVDEKGRTYDIHHIDGNRKNNHPSNIIALSVVDHFWEHWINGEYGCCFKITKRMEITPEELSQLSKKSNKERVENGTHHFLGGEIARRTQRNMVKNGTHHLLGGEISKKSNADRIANGTHNFLGGESVRKRVNEGTHNFLNPVKIKCPHCSKIGDIGNMKRWHFDKCKQKP